MQSQMETKKFERDLECYSSSETMSCIFKAPNTTVNVLWVPVVLGVGP